jgi:hypothetical protein
MQETFPSGLVVRWQPLPEGFDPLKASENELIKHGFPPRPKEPRLLSEWEKVMHRLASMSFTEPQFFRTNRRHLPAIRDATTHTNPTWSGGVVSLPWPSSVDPEGAKFFIAYGQWTVPSVTPAGPISNFRRFHCSSWVGIDGWNSNDVLQAGVHCAAQNTSAGVVETEVYPWFEWFPENEIRITDLIVSAGDSVSCLVSATSSTTANVILANSTTDKYVAVEMTAPGSTTLVGDTAEWIVERPQEAGVNTQLANYGSVTFWDAWGGTNLPGADDAVRNPDEAETAIMTGDDGSVVSTATLGDRQVQCFFV